MSTKIGDRPCAQPSVQEAKGLPGQCQKATNRLHAGMTCPRCHAAVLDYNGLLQLVCPTCGVLEAGAST